MDFTAFDEHARTAMIVAGEQALRGWPEIGVDHLALGVVHELDPRGFEALAGELARGAPTAGRLPFSAAFMAALDDARASADRVTIADLAAATGARAELSQPARAALARVT